MSNIRDITNLVFEGGSVKGIAYLGALEELEKNGFNLNQVQRIAGTSAGAITAALLGAGYSLEMIRQALHDLDFKSLLDEKSDTKDFFFAAMGPQKQKIDQGTATTSRTSAMVSAASAHPIGSSRVSSRLSGIPGIYDGEELRLWVEERLYIATGIRHITFKELHDLKLNNSNTTRKYKDVFVTGVNLTTSHTTPFDYLRTPDDIISDAVRISASIPYLFQPHVRYRKNERGERELVHPEHIFTDGGVLDNYPISWFDITGLVDNLAESNLAFWQPKHNPHTLGFRLVSKENLDYFTAQAGAPENRINSFFSYTKALLQTIRKKQNSDHQLRGDQSRTVYIDNQGIDTFSFNLTDAEKEKLIEAGSAGVQAFLAAQAARISPSLPSPSSATPSSSSSVAPTVSLFRK